MPWPVVDGGFVDRELSEQVALVRRLVELGRSARTSSKVRTRQPLARALVAAPGWAALPESLRAEVAAELNVVAVDSLGDDGQLVDVVAKANFRALGRRFGPRTPVVAAAVAGGEAAALAASLRERGEASVNVEGETVTLTPDEVVVTETPRSGWAVASGHGETLALDLTLTPELRRAGLLREVVRLVQDVRRSTGLLVTDRVELWWVSDRDELTAALREGTRTLSEEVLAPSVTEGEPNAPLDPHSEPDLGLTFWLRVAGG
jgi:isoleucyl-tRNA synthetase